MRSIKEPWQLLGLVADGIEEVVNHIGDGKLGYRDFIILCNIAAQPGLTARDLIETTGFDQAQISRILLRFIDGGMIRRLPDPRESRRYRYFIQPGDTARHLLHASNLILERTARGESPAVGQLLLAATRGNSHYRQEIWKQARVIFARELDAEFQRRQAAISRTPASPIPTDKATHASSSAPGHASPNGTINTNPNGTPNTAASAASHDTANATTISTAALNATRTTDTSANGASNAPSPAESSAIKNPNPDDAQEDFRRRFMRVIHFLNEWSSDGRKHRHFQLTRS